MPAMTALIDLEGPEDLRDAGDEQGDNGEQRKRREPKQWMSKNDETGDDADHREEHQTDRSGPPLALEGCEGFKHAADEEVSPKHKRNHEPGDEG